VEKAICQWLRMQETDLYGGGIFKFVPKWTNASKFPEIMPKNKISQGKNEPRSTL
jgi:hypothetical protein